MDISSSILEIFFPHKKKVSRENGFRTNFESDKSIFLNYFKSYKRKLVECNFIKPSGVLSSVCLHRQTSVSVTMIDQGGFYDGMHKMPPPGQKDDPSEESRSLSCHVKANWSPLKRQKAPTAAVCSQNWACACWCQHYCKLWESWRVKCSFVVLRFQPFFVIMLTK